MEIFKQVDKRFPQGVFGDLARRRALTSAAGDFGRRGQRCQESNRLPLLLMRMKPSIQGADYPP